MQRRRGAIATSMLVLASGGVVTEGCSGSSDERPDRGEAELAARGVEVTR